MFRITVDLMAEDDTPNRVGLVVHKKPLYAIERYIMGVDDTLPTSRATVPFDLFDDDGVLCYRGILDDDPDCENQSAALRWGESDAGCTTIKVQRNGEYVQEIG